MKCENCKKLIPDRFIAPMFINGGYIRVDPACALKLKNEAHGANHDRFQGQMAQQLLEDFREWEKGKNGK